MGFGAILDRVIGTVSPAWGLRRVSARASLDLMASTEAGRRGNHNPNRVPVRRFEPDTSAGSAGRITERQNGRDDARQLVNTNPLARAAVNRWKTYVAGTGPEVRSRNPDKAWADEATGRFAAWAFSSAFEVRGRHIGQVIPEFVRSGKIDGDCAIALIDDGDYAGRVQLLTADRIAALSPFTLFEGRRVIDGVEVDEIGNAVAYHISERRTPAAEVIFHRFDWLHPDDVRGNPFASSTHDKFVACDTLMGATVTAASLAAKLALVVRTINPPRWRIPAAGENTPIQNVQDGQMVRLRAGEDITAIQGTHPQAQVSPFLIDMVRVIAAAENMPMELLLLHFGLGSFSSTNAAFTIFSAAVLEAQDDLKNGPLARLWRWWVDREIAAGRLPDSPGAHAHRWTLRPPSALFPQDQALANATLRDLGRRTYQDDCEEDGVEWTERLDEIAEYQAAATARGVRLAHSSATRPADAPAPAAAPMAQEAA